MSGRPRLLDLFCGAGGAAMGYHRAGFDVVGVDIKPQKNYPFAFWGHDALEFLRFDLRAFNAIHASPPCQAFSPVAKQQRVRRPGVYEHPNLLPPTRELLKATGLPYVVENVAGARGWMENPRLLCGSMFELDVQRHRLFEANWPLPDHQWPCRHKIWAPRFQSLDKRRGLKRVIPVYGGGQIEATAKVVGVHDHINYTGERELRERAMGIDWMTPYELTQAIPPAYTEWIGARLLEHLAVAA